jgi:hypothetical protein
MPQLYRFFSWKLPEFTANYGLISKGSKRGLTEGSGPGPRRVEVERVNAQDGEERKQKKQSS